MLAQLGLEDAADRLVRGYSGGMRRRLDLGASLVGAPRLLLLDEPTTGLDPRSRIELWDAIRALVHGGTDVLLTTQYLEEADQLADRVTIVDHGRAIATGTPDGAEGTRRARRGRGAGARCRPTWTQCRACSAALGHGGAARRRPRPAGHGPGRRRPDRPRRGGARARRAAASTIDDIGLRRPTLDEVFLTLTGRGADRRTDDPDVDADPSADRLTTTDAASAA